MRTLLAAVALVSFAAAAAPAREPAPNKALNALFEREFTHEIEEHPELGTLFGIPGFDARLTDLSPQAVARRKNHVKTVIAELNRFDPRALSTQDRISRELALESLTMNDRENAFYGELPFGASSDGWLPVSTMRGPQLFLAYVVNAASFRTAADYANYLKRLDAVPNLLAQEEAQMRAGMRSGWRPPHEAMVRVPEMFTVFSAADVTGTPLWRPFTQFPADIPQADRERITESARQVLGRRVHPAFAAFKGFVENTYLPATRKELAASKLPGGDAYYAYMVRENTTLPLDPREVHETGKREVARIRKAMDEVIASTNFKGTFPEFLAFIRTDPQFFFKTPEARLMAYRDIAKRADAELPKLFAELPRLPYGIRAMEAYEGDNSDHYSAGALDGTRAGFFEANVNNLEKRPSHEMESTLLHEAVPGHHLQNARAQELTGLPKFRRALWYVAYGEGWALYSESLGYEMGFYNDPYSHFGALSAEMLRACRLVVDTGLHSLGWTREQAIRYLADNTGVHEDYAAAEIDRYIVMPGQALGYKIGELKIKELRARAKAALGDRFDLRRFHNAVIDDGALPLTVLEARIDEWIAREKESSSPPRRRGPNQPA